MFAKKIELFLMDGAANGRWACELSNWSGKAYKIPRTLISDSKDRDDLDSTGVYFLLGKSDSPDGKARIYIGEAENLFDPIIQDDPGTEKQEKVFIKAARGAAACGQSVTDGFVVFAGSRVAKEIAPAFEKHNYFKLRRQLIENGDLSDQDDHLLFENDYVFSTSSAAASIVMGRSANGLTEWKTTSGQILKALEQD